MGENAKPVKKILIICTGNSCRSIMAEGYLAKRLKDIDASDTLVLSAGTYASNGARPTDEAIQVMKEHGIDVSGYVASKLSKIHIDNADIILVMEPHHKETVLNMSPDAEGKTYLLRSFSSERKHRNNSIKDPIGKPIEFYREVFGIIKDSMEGFLEWLQK
ncbi:MAG: low molecular weight protein arginine phosphatase [Candidatus Omnitrophica bacterium]|nr:low molecular weight protein arginine phosphatase [Candidatus Omnitrophota bacterium]